MRELAIVTDSVADLPAELCQTHDITVIPQVVIVGGRSYLDGVELSPGQFYALLKQDATPPQTSQPAPGVFLDVFRRLTRAGRKVISIHVSGLLSGTVQTARLAREQVIEEDHLAPDAVTVVDSLNASMGQGWQVLAAAEAADAGQGRTEVLRLLERIRERARLYLHVRDLEYLHKGGRISSVTALVGSLLRITPLLAMVDGAVIPAAKLRGVGQLLHKYLELVEAGYREAQAAGERFHLAVMHSDAALEAGQLRDEIVARLGLAETPLLIQTGPVIGRHVGPGALGVAFY